jgi:CIC family chloride channel protein
MFDKKLYDSVKIEELLQTAPDTIDEEKDSPKTIMKKFQESDAWNLPVVRKNKYLGFVSKSKLLTAYRKKLIEVTV